MQTEAEAAWQAGAQAEAEAEEVVGQARVGEKIVVFLSLAARWHTATIGSFSAARGAHRVDFHAAGLPPGVPSRRWLKLHEERWIPAKCVTEEAPQLARRQPSTRKAALQASERARVVINHEIENEQEKDEDGVGGELSVSEATQDVGDDGEDSAEPTLLILKERAAKRTRKPRPAEDLAAPRAKSSRLPRPTPTPMIDMTVRELIHERTQGIPTSSAIARVRQRKEVGTAAPVPAETSEDPTQSETAERGDADGERRQSSRAGHEYEGLSLWEQDAMLREDEEVVMYGAEHEEEEEEESTSRAGFAPQLRFDASGQIILDEDTLQVTTNRTDRSVMLGRVEEESGLGVTSSSYMHRSPSTAWAEADTMAFFEALRKHGTDFTLIASIFPNRNRRQIKNKFKREEKERPEVRKPSREGGAS